MSEQQQLFDDPGIERLGLALSALVAEVSILSDRLNAVMAVAEARGLFSEADVEAFLPDDTRSRKWQQARQTMIANVFEPLIPAEEA